MGQCAFSAGEKYLLSRKQLYTNLMDNIVYFMLLFFEVEHNRTKSLLNYQRQKSVKALIVEAESVINPFCLK